MVPLVTTTHVLAAARKYQRGKYCSKKHPILSSGALLPFDVLHPFMIWFDLHRILHIMLKSFQAPGWRFKVTVFHANSQRASLQRRWGFTRQLRQWRPSHSDHQPIPPSEHDFGSHVLNPVHYSTIRIVVETMRSSLLCGSFKVMNEWDGEETTQELRRVHDNQVSHIHHIN